MKDELGMRNERRETGERFITIYCLPSTLYLLVSYFILHTSYFILPPQAAANAHPDWGAANVQRRIAIQSGGGETSGTGSTDISVWEDASRANITGGAVNMTPAGDGTYEYQIKLTRGTTYNYVFFVKTDASPPPGLNANHTYFDTCHWSTNTYIPTSTSSTTFSAPSEPVTSVARFKRVGPTNDSRRVITVPRSLAANTTLWVFNNYASTPTAPINFQAQPIDSSSILITWGKPYGYWGSGSESFAAADVIRGGVYRIRHSTGNAAGPYEDLVTLPGSTFSYTRTGLSAGVTYYYIIMSSDAYRGPASGALTTAIPNNYSGYSASTASAFPQAPRPVRFKVENLAPESLPQCFPFQGEEDLLLNKEKVGMRMSEVGGEGRAVRWKVENIDWEKVESKHQHLVWMTPWDEDGREYPTKEPGRIARVYLPRKDER